AFRSNEELKEIGEKVTRVRRTQKAWTKGNALGTKGTTKVLAPTVVAEVQDLDEVTTLRTVASALKAQTGYEIADTAITMRKGRLEGTQTARFRVPVTNSELISKVARLKVGFLAQ
uniref:Uncharacterized protein n=1 Tax=Anopheles dirus TaxID=7168 RepID=A0A182NDH4_9DIPT